MEGRLFGDLMDSTHVADVEIVRLWSIPYPEEHHLGNGVVVLKMIPDKVKQIIKKNLKKKEPEPYLYLTLFVDLGDSYAVASRCRFGSAFAKEGERIGFIFEDIEIRSREEPYEAT